MYSPQIKFTPIGEYIRLVVLMRLSRGPATTKEIDELVKTTVERLGVSYDWRIWPELLLEGEVEIKGDIAVITPRGRRILELTEEEVEQYVRRWLGVV
jgi:hypothetical protein